MDAPQLTDHPANLNRIADQDYYEQHNIVGFEGILAWLLSREETDEEYNDDECRQYRHIELVLSALPEVSFGPYPDESSLMLLLHVECNAESHRDFCSDGHTIFKLEWLSECHDDYEETEDELEQQEAEIFLGCPNFDEEILGIDIHLEEYKIILRNEWMSMGDLRQTV